MTPLRVDSVTIFKIRSHGCGVLNSETACNSPQSATQHLLYLVLQHALFFRTETRKRSDQLTTANQMGQHLTPKSRRKRRNLKTSDSFGPSSSPKDWFSLSCCFFSFCAMNSCLQLYYFLTLLFYSRRLESFELGTSIYCPGCPSSSLPLSELRGERASLSFIHTSVVVVEQSYHFCRALTSMKIVLEGEIAFS